MADVLDRFSEPTRAWFAGAFAAATDAQVGAWEAISEGDHALVVAPTGSGKTLAAFLWALDRLGVHADSDARGTRVLYVSPLKALAVDVERNLRSPLVGIAQTARRLGVDAPDVRVGVRSGDTPPTERRRLTQRPPDILITTPESLFLMLTSAARESLGAVDCVIIDEIHAIAGTKRGAHLALSLERLDSMLDRPAQRIGLSATVRPHDEVARFLGGAAPVRVVAPPTAKRFDLSVTVPVEDMTELTSPSADAGPNEAPTRPSIWPHIEERIVDLIAAHSSTIVFANSRRAAERLTARINEIHAERVGTAEVDAAHSPPAQIMAQSGASEGVPPALARAHHGSVSKEQRATIEDDLKSGLLPCVVATSSLELGIDMGAVDLVVQVESPPSVASGLQRVGRAGHQVGEVSRGVVFPSHRSDLVSATVVAERMRAGEIETLAVPSNPLDVLAQHTVSACALEAIDVDEWYDRVRRSAPFTTLPRSAYDATLDLLAGRYPSDEFAELRPRIVWDRVNGELTGRPGAQRLAVTSGGTIPDRGLYGVFLAGAEAGSRGARVGELDEEMVYESRVGDVFALGTTSWRIEDITHDRVLVSPAYGLPGRLPFWKGDALGRPVELGRAVGSFLRAMTGRDTTAALERCRAAGLDDWAIANLTALVEEQRAATGRVPHDRQLLVERFRDELGDWRVVLHSPYGMQVHAPWSLAVAARVRDRFDIDGAVVANDDGIIVRLPETDAEPPGAELFSFDADEIESLVTAEIGGSALFAARFRECAARALLLPRRDPGRRSPLWQQRQRSAQLLEVAHKYPSFPIVLEAVRECLQDVYDVPALHDLMSRIEARTIRVAETTTPQPSPFARALLFGFMGSFVYEGDSPLAERRAAALALDSRLLSELLGRAELRELLDADVIAQVESELQRLAPDRRARDVEGIADLLRLLGPLSADDVRARSEPGVDVGAALQELVDRRRAVALTLAGEARYAAIEDIARLRDAVGVPVPIGTPEAFVAPVDDPLGDLVGRYARTHGPFVPHDVAVALGIGDAVVLDTVRRLATEGRVVEGEFRPHLQGGEWCDAEVLRRIRRRSLAALRKEIEPVPPDALARFLPVWQHVGGRLRGIDGVATVVDQLAGSPVPASALEPLVLGSRVADYTPAMLDELMSSGEVVWAGSGSIPGNDGWVSLHLADTAPLTLPTPVDAESAVESAVLEALAGGGAFFFRALSDAVARTRDEIVPDDELHDALWDLVWSGRVTNDTLTPLRTLLSGGRTAHRSTTRPPRARTARRGGAARPRMPSRTGPATAAGRWSLLPAPETDATLRAHAHAELLLERCGVVTRGAVVAERTPGGFSAIYKVLSAFEESGRSRRGYFVESLGAAQFGTTGAVDRLRTFVREPTDAAPGDALVLAATDPANPYGAALPWPERADDDSGHRPGRKAGAVVVLLDGRLVLYLERGGRTVLTFTDGVEPAVRALAAAVSRGSLGALSIERVNGERPMNTGLAEPLKAAGFHATPRGMRLRG
ncbi:ATP-dependent helicase [Solicola gregarius]|uniref:ATP-dependent helicase n=1 Tax=Solicola gregarius TaxID=2908642 RepID=A0AA46TG85_9ACTN|nr:ATP-dependent helicase [Solicola gregarius]UYM04536.1 ATP-dependent helicase [Solicola gregarius]